MVRYEDEVRAKPEWCDFCFHLLFHRVHLFFAENDISCKVTAYPELCSISFFQSNGLSYSVLWDFRLVDVVPSLEEYMLWLVVWCLWSFHEEVRSRQARRFSGPWTRLHGKKWLRCPVMTETRVRVRARRMDAYHRPGHLPSLLQLQWTCSKWCTRRLSETAFNPTATRAGILWLTSNLWETQNFTLSATTTLFHPHM